MDIKINILNENIKIPQPVVDAANGDELLGRIFYNRGYTDPDTIRQMLREELYRPTQISEFPRMEEAVERIVRAVDRGEEMLVYGDYDVDGVTSTVTLVQCLTLLSAKVSYHVPDRFTEGYGMNAEVVGRCRERGVTLIITCDCGISNTDEIAYAKSLGMDVVVTDHHNLPERLPPADVILNPKLLGKGHRASNLSGCGMAFFLVKALLRRYEMEHRAEEFLDLLALSLVADVVSLNGENRYLLRKALPLLFNTGRPGLKALFGIIEKDSKLQTEEDIAFQIAPRINAAGRMESARLPVELLLCGDALTAGRLAEKLDFLNTERKRVQQQIVAQAAEMVESRKKNKTVLVLFNELWHHGIIGIAAGKICENYRKPAVLLSMKEDGTTVVGSARSVEGVDIYELIKACGSRLLKFGGHTAAAGLSLHRKDLEAFTAELEQLAERKHHIRDQIRLDVDAELDIGEVGEELYGRLQSAGPYGEGFEPPLFVSRKWTVASDRKTERNHHIMVLAGERERTIPAVWWFGEDKSFLGGVVDVIYKIGRNTYRGNNGLQLTVDCLVESSGKPRKVFEGRLIDGRGQPVQEILSRFGECLVFYEGVQDECPLRDVVDRYGVKPAKNLLFLSTPVNSGIFREVVARAAPGSVIVNFSVLPEYSLKGFIVNFMRILKHVFNHEDGRTTLEQLALKSCVEEGMVKASLKYLKACGKVEYSIRPDDDGVYICRGGKADERTVYAAEKNLKDALAEKKAYLQFITRMEIERFGEYLK